MKSDDRDPYQPRELFADDNRRVVLMWKSRTEGITVYKCPISQDCVTNIFIGLKHCAPVAELVAEAKRTFPNAGIFRAKKRHGDLALDFEEL
jgi:hypothetical protein